MPVSLFIKAAVELAMIRIAGMNRQESGMDDGRCAAIACGGSLESSQAAATQSSSCVRPDEFFHLGVNHFAPAAAGEYAVVAAFRRRKMQFFRLRNGRA